MRYTVTVKPKASVTKLIEKNDETKTLTIALHAQPFDGEANEELIRFLSKEFHIPKTRISLLRGHRSRIKIVDIT